MQKEFITLPLDELIPYENNPRINDKAVHDVKQSIIDCGNCDPIEIDEDNVILSGHTRLMALQELGYEETECVRFTGLTEEQKRKYRILANKTNELAEWDEAKLYEEMDGLDFSNYDNDLGVIKIEDIDGEVLEPEEPIARELDEANNYIVLEFFTEQEWEQAQYIFGLEKVQTAEENPKIRRHGIGRVIRGKEILEKLKNED